MNVYDKAYDLARALKESDEWVTLVEARAAIDGDEAVKGMYTSLRTMQFELQQKQMSGQELTPEDIENWQKQYEISALHSDVKKLLEAESKFSQIFEDIQKILYDSLNE